MGEGITTGLVESVHLPGFKIEAYVLQIVNPGRFG